jgi:hypothetical protein
MATEWGYKVPVALCVKFKLWQASTVVSCGYYYNDGPSDGRLASGGRIPCTYCDADHRLTYRLYSSRLFLIRNFSYYTSRLNSFQFVSRSSWWVQSYNQQRRSVPYYFPFYVIFHNFIYHITSPGSYCWLHYMVQRGICKNFMAVTSYHRQEQNPYRPICEVTYQT